jgi:hypothetical protein
MISTVCFYGIGVYFLIEGAVLRDMGGATLAYGGLLLAGVACILGGARFIIADVVARVRVRRS